MSFTRILVGLWLLAWLIVPAQRPVASSHNRDGRFLFEQETFGGNGRTCLTCHSRDTGTVSPIDAQRRFAMNRIDPLFRHDGSDDGRGNGVQRMLTEATVLVTIPLPPNVSLADDPAARSVTVRRGIPSTLNTPALDPVLMLDGREPDLVSQARNAILGHGQASGAILSADLELIARFQQSDSFFSSPAVRDFARGGPAPSLPAGNTESEKRGRTFFENRFDPNNLKLGSCALCHSGPMLDRTNQFFPPGPGLRFLSVSVSEFNEGRNPVRPFIFRNPDGSQKTILSPDPGRALITGRVEDANAFKISSLRGIRRTAPYFHDNSARTLEEVMAHYTKEFLRISPRLALTPQDEADVVAYLKLLE
jgi:cytochrome c peroxidase